MVYSFSFLLEISFALLHVDVYHSFFLLTFLVIYGICFHLEIFFYLHLSIGSCRYTLDLDVYPHITVVYLAADEKLRSEVRDKQHNVKLRFF